MSLRQIGKWPWSGLLMTGLALLLKADDGVHHVTELHDSVMGMATAGLWAAALLGPWIALIAYALWEDVTSCFSHCRNVLRPGNASPPGTGNGKSAPLPTPNPDFDVSVNVLNGDGSITKILVKHGQVTVDVETA